MQRYFEFTGEAHLALRQVIKALENWFDTF